METKDQIKIVKVQTTPFAGQKPGTSGLRKKVIDKNPVKCFVFKVKEV